MNSPSGRSIFLLTPSLNATESEYIRALAGKSTVHGNEIEPVPVKADVTVLSLDLIVFPLPNGTTYIFRKSRTNEQDGKFGWYGETQDGSVTASFIRLSDRSLHASAYVAGAPESSPLKAHYYVDASATGLGLFRKLSPSPPNFPRHGPGWDARHERMRKLARGW